MDKVLMEYFLSHSKELLTSKRLWTIVAGMAAHYAVSHGWVSDQATAQAYATQVIDAVTGVLVVVTAVMDNHKQIKADKAVPPAPKQ